MKPIMAFVKSYPIIVASIVIAVVSLILLIMIWPSGSSFTKEVSRRSAVMGTIDNLMRTQMVVPPKKPDGQPRTVTGPVNQPAINALQTAYNEMTNSYKDIFKEAETFNHAGHTPMLDGVIDANGKKTFLFPEPTNPTMAFDAKDVYRATLLALLQTASLTPDFASVHAGSRYNEKETAEFLDAVEKEFLAKRFPLDPAKQLVTNLDETQLLELKKLQIKKLFDQHEARAKQINVYAAPARDFDDLKSPDFPLHVGQWSLDSGAPQMSQVWDGQMGLWIQQDIIRAIALTNRVTDPQSNVLTSPIKRLIRIHVIDGYVGVGGALGGMNSGAVTDGSGPASIRPQVPTTPFPGGPGPGYPEGPGGFSANGGLGPNVQTEAVNSYSADEPLPDDFRVAHTGRRSNDIYDVKHAQITLHIATRDINTFINNLARVNFITVLSAKITNVDEYELFDEGYVYGKDDVVELELLVESIWLRNWTRQYMPREVRLALGVEKAKDPAAGATGAPGATPPAIP